MGAAAADPGPVTPAPGSADALDAQKARLQALIVEEFKRLMAEKPGRNANEAAALVRPAQSSITPTATPLPAG